MGNNFEYKIHVSIDQKGLGDDVRKELSKIATEAKDAFKIKFTGDPKDLIKQLADLKRAIPDLDLTKGVSFELADIIKDNTSESKKLVADFTTFIINSVNDAVSSIDNISESIKKTQDVLEGFKNRKRELLKDDGTASAVSAFEKAEKRFLDASNKFSDSKQNKGKLAAAEEMKRAYQDILNYQEEAGREMSEKTKQILGVFAQDVSKTFTDISGKEHSLKDFLGDVKVNSSYKKDLQDLEGQIFSTENKLRDLKKELENAKNPEMKIKGKLADNFLSDLQAQLDAMTGLEVKVKPKIDEDVKLEVEVNGDVKPNKNLSGNLSNSNPPSARLYEHSDGQLSLFKEEIELKREDTKATEELYNAEQKLASNISGQMTIDDFPEKKLLSEEQRIERIQQLKEELSRVYLGSFSEDPHFDFEFEKNQEIADKIKNIITELRQLDSNINIDSLLKEAQEGFNRAKQSMDEFNEALREVRKGTREWSLNKLLNDVDGFSAKLNALLEEYDKLTSTEGYDEKQALNLEARIHAMLGAQSQLFDMSDTWGKELFSQIQEKLSDTASHVQDRMWDNMANGRNLNTHDDLRDAVSETYGLHSYFINEIDLKNAQQYLELISSIQKIYDSASQESARKFYDGRMQIEQQAVDELINRLLSKDESVRQEDPQWVENQYKYITESLNKVEEYKSKLAELNGEFYEPVEYTTEVVKDVLSDKFYDMIGTAHEAKEAIAEVNTATSTPPNTSAMDTVEEELHEEAQAHRENAEAAKADAKAQEEFNSQKNIRKPHDEYRDNQIKFLQDYKKISDEYIELDTRDYDEPLSDKEEKRLDELRVKIKEYDEILEQYSDVRVRLKNGESYSIIDNLDSHDWNTKKSAIKDIVFELKEEAEQANKTEQAFNSLGEKIEYLKTIKKESKFLETADERKMDMEEKAWDAGGNNPKSEADSLNKIRQYEELCDHIDTANNAIDTFNEKYEKVIVTMKNGQQVELFDAFDLDDLSLAKKGIRDIEFVLREEAAAVDEVAKVEPDINKVRDALGKIMDQMNTSQITGRNLFDWIKENASESEKELFDISKGYEEFQKLLVGASFGSKGLFEYRDGAGLDIFNYNKNNLSSGTTSLPSQIDEITQAEDRMGNEAQEAGEQVATTTGQIQEGLAETETRVNNLRDALIQLFSKFTIGNIKSLNIGQLLGIPDVKATDIYKDLTPIYNTIQKLTGKEKSGTNDKIVINGSKEDDVVTEEQIQKLNQYRIILNALGYELGEIHNRNKEDSLVWASIIPTDHAITNIEEIIDALTKLNIIQSVSNQTPASTEGASSSISKLEKEAGLRQENVQLTDAQIEAELKRQNEAVDKTPLTGDEAIVRYIDELDQMYEKEKLTGEELEKLFATSRNADAGSALELLSSELEKASDVLRPEDLSGNLDKVVGKFKELGISITDIRKLLQGDKTSISWVGTNGDRQENISKAIELLKQLGLEVESVNNPDKFNTTITARTQAQVEAFHREKQAAEEVKEVVEELGIDLDELANHPFPTDDIFTNKKIAAEQSIRQLESFLPGDYQGDVGRQIVDLHTELSELTEDKGLSLWRTKFEVVAKSVKNVREEVDALAKNQKKAMSEAVSDANLSTGITKARNDIKEMSESMSKLGVTKFDEEFKKLNEELGNVGNNSDKLKIVRAKIDELKIGLREATAEAEALLNKQKAVYESLKENITQKAELEAQNIRYEQKGMQGTDSYKNNVDKINALEEEINAVDRLTLSEEQLRSIEDAEAEAAKKVQQALDLQQQSIKQAEEANKRQAQTLEKTRAALQKQASSLMNNGKLMKQYGDQVHALYEEIQNPSTTISRLEQIRVELNKISAEATAAGKSGKSFFQMLQQRAQSLLAYLGTFASFYRVVGYIRTAITTISDLDTQLVDLRKTTQMNTLELDEFYRTSTNVGKELGVTTSEIISQAAAWSRLGYNTKEASEQMAALSSKFASISPGVEINDATDYLVSTMQAFKKLPEDVERDIMDNINAIGNTMATTNGEIGEMLERSSAAMKAANNTLEETIALEAAAVEITRNAETTGTAFRTISMRIRGYDEETEELSDDLKNISGEIADLTKTTKNAPISIFTDESKSEYKSTYQILKEIAGIWENLTDKQQAQLLEKLGGKRGAQSLAGILADFSSVEKALETMSEAGGSAEREMNIIRESLDFKVNALKQTWVGIIQDLIDRGVISDVVDGLTKISVSLGKLITQFGVLKTAVVSIGGLFAAKKFGLLNFLKGDFSGIDNLRNKVIELSVSGQSLKEVSKSINEIQTISASRDIFAPEGINVTTIELYRKSLQGLTVDQKALALSTSGLTKAEIEEVLTRQDSAIVSQAISKAEAEAIISKMGLASATKVLSESELEELGTRVGLEAQTIKNALIETGLVTVKDGDIIATQKLTQSEIEEALTSQGAALADKQQTAQIIAETIAKKQATQATVKYAGTSNLLVGAFNKLKAVITKHPLLTLATIIGGSIYALRKYKNSIDDLIDSSKEIVSTYQSTSKELAKNKGEFNSLSEKYVELSKGVDSLGHNVNLTTDEYEEYRTVVNRIADLSPDLISGYNDQGDAILYIRDSVDALTDSYNKNIIAANNDIIANGTKVMEARKESRLQYGNEDNVQRYKLQDIEDFLKGSKDAKSLMGSFTALYSGGLYGYEYKDLAQLLRELGIDVGFTKDDEWYTTEAEAAEFNKKLQDTLEHLTSDQRAILEAYVSRKNAEYENIFEGDRELLKAYIQNSLLTDEDLKEIPDNLKTILMNYADNIDVDILSTFNSPEKLSSYANQITNTFKGLSDSQQEQLEFGINLSTSWNNNELSYDEYIEQIQAFNTLLSELFPDNEEIQKTFKILFDIPNEEDLAKQKNVFLNRISETRTSSMKSDPEISDEAIQEAINKGNEVAEAWYNSLTKSERDFVANISDEDFANAIKFDSTKQFDAWLDKLKNVAANEDINVKVKASDAVDSMADAKTAITSLEELWNQTVQDSLALGKDKKYLDASGNVIKQLNDKNQAVGFADPALINSVESAFYKFSEQLEKEGNDAAANKINSALEEFEKTLTEFPGDADKAQEAIDNLITAYIDQTDIIQNLTEENAEWSKAQLKAYGVTNAEEVVMSRLNNTTRQLTKQFKEATSALNTLTSAQEGSQEYNDAADDISGKLSEMFTTNLPSGEQIIPNFDASWVIENLNLLTEAANGSVEAMWKVQQEAAKKIAMQIDINAPNPAAVNDIQNQINSLINNFDIKDVTVGTSINTSPMIKGLNSLVDAGVITRDSMNAILSGIGVEPQVTYKDIPISVNMAAAKNELRKQATTGENYYNSKYMLDAIDNGTLTGNVRIPVIDYVVSGKSTGAKYAAPGGTSSSGGGGGGGGGGGSSSEPNKPKQEAEETFDWIEVAIQRIEEEIARLDKVVGNTYDFWTNRNKALLKEIDKTKEEIKAQQIAYSEYLRNANDIEVNNGKGLNPDDYGENDADVKKHDQELLNKAIAAWKTGEYQKKVREGLLSGKDIEKIANHFLTDTIKEYQEWYNKAIAVSDAMQDNKIKLGDLARTDFDHIKTEYDEILQYFEAYADLIDKRISRTEEKGYFVSKNYYDQLTDYENKSITTLREETDKLIKKRDEAVNAGDIALNSEEYHKMTQEILDNLQSIEERTNNIYENANKIRQIDWDIFDYIEDRISKVTDEFEFLIDLLDNQKMYDDYGIFNERGWANTALHAGKYNTYMQQALDYAKERKKIELEEDKADKNLIERREELIQLQQESIKNAYAEKDAVKSLVEEGINIHLSKLKELIDDYKKAQQESKSLYEYQKNISKQTENIGNLRKQLNAYVGDTSEEARATIQKLSKSLEDAETQLKETQWDKYISETETFLSDMYDEYEETLNARLDDIDLLMHDMIDEVNARGTEISGIIKEVSGEVAYELTDYTKTFISNGTLVSDFKNKFDTEITNVESILGNIQKYIADIANKQVTPAVNENSIKRGTKLNNHATYKGVDYSTIFDLEYYMNKYPNLVSVFGTDYDKYIEHFVNYGMKEGRQASETFNLEYYKKKYPDLARKYGNNNQAYYEHFIEYGIKEGRQASETFSVQMYKNLYEDLAKSFKNNLKKYYEHYNNHGRFEGRRAYATGSKHINSDQLAWTQEQGGELIYRSTDGAILTPLNVGDKVFTAEMSENLWNLAQLKQRPVVSTGAGRTVNNTNAISINLPNVQNYEQFKNALQNDPNMTKFIQQVTFGEATNGIKLNRKKY